MRHPYLIHLDDPADWLDCRKDYDNKTGDLVEEQHDILWPEGAHQMYEFNDSFFYKSTTYHEHKVGWETFFIKDGKMDLCVRGKTATVEPGDVIFIPPYTPHKMTTLSERVVWNGMFHDIGMLTGMNYNAMIRATNPKLLEDPEMQANYLANKNNLIRENPQYEERVIKDDIYEIRQYHKPLAVNEYPGIKLLQYTGRWENDGLTELWLAELKKGVKVKYNIVDPNVDMFYVIEGEVKFIVAGEEFIAGPRSLVKIPQYAPRYFETLTDAKMYDAGGSTHWLDFLGDIKALKTHAPEKYEDKQYLKGVMKRHECFVESVDFGDVKVF
jgi:quercetin dioxygenase-like cupin family protein